MPSEVDSPEAPGLAEAPVLIGCVCEDRPFLDLLQPLIRRCVPRAVSFETELTHGCRLEALRERLRRVEEREPALIIVGADASAPDHRRSAKSARQKARSLESRLPPPIRPRILAIAQPCVEAWLMDDLGALRAGLSAALGEELHLPSGATKAPRTESETKSRLAGLIATLVGGGLPRNGFEYATHVVDRFDLTSIANQGLAAFVRELTKWAESLGPASA